MLFFQTKIDHEFTHRTIPETYSPSVYILYTVTILINTRISSVLIIHYYIPFSNVVITLTLFPTMAVSIPENVTDVDLFVNISSSGLVANLERTINVTVDPSGGTATPGMYVLIDFSLGLGIVSQCICIIYRCRFYLN